jgi:CRP-like cAMP-binding protein
MSHSEHDSRPVASDISVERLQAVRILERLSAGDLVRIGKHARLLRLPPRQTIYSPESADEATYLLLSGKVKLFQASDEGRDIIVEIVQDGEVFGELRPSDGRGGMWAETLEDSEMAVLPRGYLNALMRRHPEVALGLVEEMSQRLQQRASQIEDLALRNVPARVASALLRLGESHGIMSRNGIRIDLRLTHQDIADMVAAARETVTNVLGDMREGGIIDIEQHHVRIGDPAHLQAMARTN